MLPKALATEVFAELPVDKQSHIINSITDKELSEIVDELYVDDAVDLVEELPATVVRRVLTEHEAGDEKSSSTSS